MAEGFEELEALAPVDILRRGKVDVKTVGVGKRIITGSHGIPVECDVLDTDIEIPADLQAVILPGGLPGTTNLEKSDVVNRFIDYAAENGILIAAICAAPSILGHKGLLKDKKATCYPSFEKELLGATVLELPVVEDGNIITSRGAGAAYEFAFSLLAKITGNSSVADDMRGAMCCP